MSSSLAAPSQGNAGAAASGSAPVVGTPSHTFSADAAPFVPSFMRVTAAVAPPQPPAPAVAESDNASTTHTENDVEGSMEGSEDDYRQHFSKMWLLCLEQMQGHEVGMLMDMMPPDIQDLYADKLSDEYLHHDHEHKDKGVHALCAAHKMVKELSPEQLVHIEEFLVESDALNPEARRRPGGLLGGEMRFDSEGNLQDDSEEGDAQLFLNADDGMGQEEEAWLLEQMMAAAGHKEEDTKTAGHKKKRK